MYMYWHGRHVPLGDRNWNRNWRFWNWNYKLWNWNWDYKIWKCRIWNWDCKIEIDPSPDQYIHYGDVIMSAMASEITSLTFVYLTIYSDIDQRKHQSSASLAFVRGIHRWPVISPAQRASDAENVFIWWRHHGTETHVAGNWKLTTDCVVYIPSLVSLCVCAFFLHGK